MHALAARAAHELPPAGPVRCDLARVRSEVSAPGISATYTYDTETGRKVGQSVTAAGVSAASTYVYTGAGRLAGALTGVTQRTYTFDERGNLKVATTGSATTAFTVDSNNRLLSMSDSSGNTTYGHDALGRRTSQTLSGVTTTYAYDDASRLVGWARGADNATYTYDAAGQRTRAVVKQGSTTTTTTYTYDGITLLALSAAQGTAAWTVAYLYDEDGRPYAGVYTAGTSAPVTFLIATNDRGDVVGLTDTAGAWFARHCDPASASFLTKDPARDDGEESAYQYCAGDPVGKVDPTGMWAWAVAGAVVGGAVAYQIAKKLGLTGLKFAAAVAAGAVLGAVTGHLAARMIGAFLYRFASAGVVKGLLIGRVSIELHRVHHGKGYHLVGRWAQGGYWAMKNGVRMIQNAKWVTKFERRIW